MKKLLKTHEIADAIGVHYQTINNWRKARKIPFMQPSRTVFFDLEAVLEAVNHKRIETAE
jgi:hypothetical protein